MHFVIFVHVYVYYVDFESSLYTQSGVVKATNKETIPCVKWSFTRRGGLPYSWFCLSSISSEKPWLLNEATEINTYLGCIKSNSVLRGFLYVC